jgi:chemotaxis protein methyltransferase CheR
MTDQECVEFLQRALPRLGLRWPGFRNVRRQVHKRINRRMEGLGLAHIADYRSYLETHPDEWRVLDGFTLISISRFYRDRGLFDHLREVVLPELARAVQKTKDNRIRCWCAGCASGEEPYTLTILWNQRLQEEFPRVRLELVATDVDVQILQRAHRATYPRSSVKDLPVQWLTAAFIRSGEQFALRPEFQQMVKFQQQDIRREMPRGPFELILCRNLVFTYFADDVQKAVLRQLVGRLVGGGFLVIGKKEAIPDSNERLRPHDARLGIYRTR